MRYFEKDLTKYATAISKNLGKCTSKEDFSFIGDKISVEGIPFKIMPQHAIWNAIVESYLPVDIDMKKEGLYYGGDFSIKSIEELVSRIHSAILKYAFSQKNWKPATYFRNIDNFNKTNAAIFESEDIVYHDWEKKWDIFMRDNSFKRPLSPVEIHGIIMQNIQFAFTMYSYIFDGKLMSFLNGLDSFDAICRADAKAAKIIREGVFDNNDSLFETLRKRREAGVYVMDVIKSKNIQPLAGMIHAGAAKEEQLIDLLIGIGAKPFINENSSTLNLREGVLGRKYGSFLYPKTCHASYLRGLNFREEHYLSTASAMTSLMITKTMVAEVADMNKRMTLSSKRFKTHQDRDHKCGTVHFRNHTIHKKSDLRRIEGMYEQVGNKSIKIDTDDFDRYKGKTIQLRTPIFCNTIEGGVCRYCLGDKLYDLNNKWTFKEGDMNIATLWANYIGPIVQQSVLSPKHNQAPNPKIPTYAIDRNGVLDYSPSDIKFEYKYEDRVFIRFKDKLIVPDFLELVHPKKMWMPWTNEETAYFSDRIRIILDGETYVVYSDTSFFIYENEYHSKEIALRHLYENIGVTHLFNAMSFAANTFGIKDQGKNDSRYDVQAYCDLLDHISPKEHIAFFHLLFADNVRIKDNESELPDFSVPNLDLVVMTVDQAILSGFSLSATFAAGYFIENMINPDNHDASNKLVTDIDNVI